METPLVVAQSAEELAKIMGGCWDSRPFEKILGDSNGTQEPVDWKEIIKCY